MVGFQWFIQLLMLQMQATLTFLGSPVIYYDFVYMIPYHVSSPAKVKIHDETILYSNYHSLRLTKFQYPNGKLSEPNPSL